LTVGINEQLAIKRRRGEKKDTVRYLDFHPYFFGSPGENTLKCVYERGVNKYFVCLIYLNYLVVELRRERVNKQQK